MTSIIAAVLTVSDRSFRGEREDLSGPLLSKLVTALGGQVVSYAVVPDEVAQIRAALLDLADRQGVDVIVTTGGTGPAPRDVTPEATRRSSSGRCLAFPSGCAWKGRDALLPLLFSPEA